MRWATEIHVSRAAELNTITSGIELPIHEMLIIREERDIFRMALEMWLAYNSDPMKGVFKHGDFEIHVIGD